MTKRAGLLESQTRFGSGCTLVDYDRDGQLDLFVGNYVVFEKWSEPRAGGTGSCNC